MSQQLSATTYEQGQSHQDQPGTVWQETVVIQPRLPFEPRLQQEKNGVVYTKAWVVELMLDLAEYTSAKDLVNTLAVEPAAGDGAFLALMAKRLIASCKRQQRPVLDCTHSLLAYELDEESAARATAAIMKLLQDEDVAPAEATVLACSWIHLGDYLLEAPSLPHADFVIGNPPYIRLEDMDEDTASVYRTAYRTMTGRADIYIAFYEAALRQLKRDGVCAFICADRWMLNQYGAELRRFITAGYSVETVIEMHNADAFASEVSAYPAITVLRRTEQGPVVVATAETQAEAAGADTLGKLLTAVRSQAGEMVEPHTLRAAQVETWFQQSDPWPRLSPERLALLKRLEREFDPLESQDTGTRVGIGVATGLDRVFITRDPHCVEESRLLPLAMASDTTSGTLAWSGHYLVNPWTEEGLVDLTRFPRLRSYYEQQRQSLLKRNVGQRNPRQWYRTIDRVNHPLVGERKLYIPDIKDVIAPVLDEGQTYPHHNLYYVHSTGWDIEVLGGLLLSAIGQFFVTCYGVRMRGGYLRFQAQYLRRIRVPKPATITAHQAASLIQAFRTRDVALATRTALDVYRIPNLPMEDADGR